MMHRVVYEINVHIVPRMIVPFFFYLIHLILLTDEKTVFISNSEFPWVCGTLTDDVIPLTGGCWIRKCSRVVPSDVVSCLIWRTCFGDNEPTFQRGGSFRSDTTSIPWLFVSLCKICTVMCSRDSDIGICWPPSLPPSLTPPPLSLCPPSSAVYFFFSLSFSLPAVGVGRAPCGRLPLG